jgi:hypothetical protein
METPEELGIEDTSLLTDADWAEINKLRRAFSNGGERALKKACNELADDPRRWIRVFGAFSPDKMREALKDAMARAGITKEDLIELARKPESPARKQ